MGVLPAQELKIAGLGTVKKDCEKEKASPLTKGKCHDFQYIPNIGNLRRGPDCMTESKKHKKKKGPKKTPGKEGVPNAGGWRAFRGNMD